MLAHARRPDAGFEMSHHRGMETVAAQAREAIRDLVARYNAYGDTGRFDELLELFTVEAWVEIPERGRYEGRNELRKLFTGAAQSASPGAKPERIAHHVSGLVVDLDTDDPTSAKGSCYYAVLGQIGLDHWGRYRDIYRIEDRAWRFASRRVTVDGRVPGGWADRNLAGA